jgi:ribosome-associated protein
MEEKSKSQRKRDAEALKKIALKLVDLTPTKLNDLPLPENLRQAIIDAKSIKSHGATRRQAQLIGKLMRCADHETILQAYAQIVAQDNAKTAVFHDLEQWRNRLIDEGSEALTEFVNCYRPANMQHLRQLVKKAIEEKANNKSVGASKALFRFLRTCIE